MSSTGFFLDIRAIGNADHVAVFANDGADIRLAELNQHIGIDGTECLGNAVEQLINALLQRLCIAAVVESEGSLARKRKAVDKVKFKAVKSPIDHGSAVNIDQCLTHVGVTGVKTPARAD